jgi:phage N-6-adenine-methyltransferase
VSETMRIRRAGTPMGASEGMGNPVSHGVDPVHPASVGVPVQAYHHPVAKRDDWETPPALFGDLDAEFRFTLDACALPHNAKCARYFTPSDDGLTREWGAETVWVNPPYGKQIAAWMRKAHDAAQRGATVTLLVPARTDSAWWHDYAARGEIRFLRGRVKFVGAPYNAPFPCAVVVFRPPVSEGPADAR